MAITRDEGVFRQGNKTGNSKSKVEGRSTNRTDREVRKSLAENSRSSKLAVKPMAVSRDFSKPLTEEEPYLVQVPIPSLPPKS